MKILIVTEVLPPKYGGADIAGLRFAEYLHSKKGYSAILIGYNNPDLNSERRNYTFPIRTIRKVNLIPPSWRFKRIVEIINFCLIYLQTFIKLFMIRDRFDIVHTKNSFSDLSFCAISVGKLLGKKVIAETCLIGADDPETIFRKRPKDWFSSSYFKRIAYSQADLFIALSESNLAYFRKHIPQSKSRVVSSFVDTNRFKPVVNSDRKKIELGLPLGRKIILFIGRLSERKGINILLEAFHKLIKEDPDIFLLVIGPNNQDQGSYVKNTKLLFQKIGPENMFHITKTISNVNEYMSQADILVLPSFKEGFPNVVVEAMCSNLLVLASDINEIKNTQIRDGENGLLFKTGDVSSLIALLRIALNNLSEMEIIKQKALEEAKRKYSIEVIFSKYDKMYQQLLLK